MFARDNAICGGLPGGFPADFFSGMTMRAEWLFLILLTCCVAPTAPLQARQTSRMEEILNRYSGLDVDADGIAEVNRLAPLQFGERPNIRTNDGELVLILVEERLLARIPDCELSVADLVSRLERFGTDLENEGYRVQFARCDLYAGTAHQDGLTVLALRRLLKEVASQEKLKGVILAGSFPEAMIVRRWLWRREQWDVSIAGKEYRGSNQQDFLRIVPEAVAPRADIVLADLDGNWESIYHKGPMELESIEALPGDSVTEWPTDEMIFESELFNDSKVSFEDFFLIQEDRFQRLESASGQLRLRLQNAQQHPELSPQDRQLPNPLAIPDILVSRINARHVAVVPERNFRDRNGNSLLNDKGQPQVVETVARINPAGMMRRDPAFERELLVDYFDRNHEFRTTIATGANRTAALSHGAGLITAESLNQYLRKSSASFGDSVSFPNGSLLDYVQLLKTPARLKGLSAHSSPWNSAYGAAYDVRELESQCGGTPWRWKEEKTDSGFRYTPSFAEQGGMADSFIHRTIYENRILAGTGSSLYIHNGCEVNTPEGATSYPYNHDRYGSSGGFQNAESILFFLNGVALASRAKTFYDIPRGFTEKIGEGSCFGEGWRAYFQVEANDPALVDNVAGNKRTYPWSLVGDWTLKLLPR